jgi:SPP1 gp7 family putative phage head morphogenesis protein
MSIPEVFYREAIDVGRFSNSVANGFIENYVKVIHEAAEQLVKLDIRQKKAAVGVVIAPQTRNRLRAIIAQSKASMDKWNKTATKQIIKELQEYANIQTGFIEKELLKVVKSGNIPVNSVAVSQKYATSFIKTDPTKINIFTSKQFTEDDFVKFGQGKFELTARQGAMMTLPNGETVEKAFRGIATKNQDLLARTIRAGVFSGESSNQIARKLMGKLDFNSLKAGGQAKLAAHQIRTVVRTSVNQVQNQASQAVYAANKKIAPKYEYVATLDSKTSNVCMRLDGRKFEYDKGPMPPQHFNCRSTTVPIVDYEGLSKREGFEDLKQPPVGKVVSRPSATGRVPQGTQYGDWLLTQDKKLQIKTLGSEGKVKIFKKLGEKIGGQSALRKIIRSDGTAIPLETLKKIYGKKNIVAKTIKPQPITAPKVKTPALKDSPVFSTQGVDDWLAKNPQAANIQQFIEESLDGMESVGGLTQKNIKKMRLFMKKGNIVNQFNMKYEKTKTLGELKQRFLT